MAIVPVISELFQVKFDFGVLLGCLAANHIDDRRQIIFIRQFISTLDPYSLILPSKCTNLAWKSGAWARQVHLCVPAALLRLLWAFFLRFQLDIIITQLLERMWKLFNLDPLDPFLVQIALSLRWTSLINRVRSFVKLIALFAIPQTHLCMSAHLVLASHL